jgi:hypothetical protein
LQERRRAREPEQHYGLVTVLAAEGDAEGADARAAEMDDELRPLDPQQADEWRARALEIRSQLGGGS